MTNNNDNAERRAQQQLITDAVTAFARRELSPAAMRPGTISRKRWQGLAELGLMAMLLPDEAGGLGLKIGDLVPALEALGKPLLREPLVASSVLAGSLLVGVARNAKAADLLEQLAAGALLAGVAWQETYRLEGDHIKTTLASDAHGHVLSGRKVLVVPGSEADGLLVSANADGKTALVWVSVDAEGVRAENGRTADGGAVATFHFDNVKIDAADILSTDAADVLAQSLQVATIAASAELLGLIRGAMDITMDYLRTRKQFNKTIGSFQSLQHRAADLFIQQELSAVAISRAAADFEAAATAQERATAASRAKARLSSAALIVTKEAIQMHGGIGYTDEHDIGLYLKRTLTLSAWLGNAAEHRARFAELTMDEAA
ncbi:acyl-CoA dehydrogenase family protein [Rhizobium sp. C4]|uniref:acyl-CoA dehydrogenase family protein n=1 Tax=Rhizobium sp. C4 TaxID=1349800 RepID=UPI001E365BA7|nr:acyl-CoA dehydrogenase family protein [Rhizobium sp. C4]MCD2172258.1 acyl-CoA/acyl-ACP dehydrogenase [Rhizobium sp. C4]